MVHRIEATVVGEDVGVTSSAINMITQIGIIVLEICPGRLILVWYNSSKLAVASFVLAHAKHTVVDLSEKKNTKVF